MCEGVFLLGSLLVSGGLQYQGYMSVCTQRPTVGPVTGTLCPSGPARGQVRSRVKKADGQDTIIAGVMLRCITSFTGGILDRRTY